MDYPAASWLSPEVEVRRSGIEGFGLFAVRGLAAGTVVERLGGRVIDDAELAALEPPYSSLTVAEACICCSIRRIRCATATTRARRICGTSTRPPSRYARTWPWPTIDYATHTGVPEWSMACSCGGAVCRGVVTGQDWRRAELRATYGDHWTLALLVRIAR
jgi:hypothetical protein